MGQTLTEVFRLDAKYSVTDNQITACYILRVCMYGVLVKNITSIQNTGFHIRRLEF